MINKRVTVAMSGGVDSAVAALLIKEQGYITAGATMRVCKRPLADGVDGSELDIRDAKAICQLLGIEHRVYNLEKEFHDKVIKNFIDTYVNGGTPNPCVECNRFLKFGALFDAEIPKYSDYVATGHYARIEQDGKGRFLLKRAKDEKKDQTYMLWSLNQEQLSHSLFPLGDYTKPEIREIGAQNGFVNAAKSDSQDICFIPDGDYAKFIEDTLGKTFAEGNYIDEDGNVLGRHKGVIHYTVGQRKGLGISMNKHIFVTDKNPKNNTVTLADEDRLFKKSVIIKGINLIPFDKLDVPIKVQAKIRYSQKSADAIATQIDNERILLEFDEAQRAPARSQSAVLYDGEYVIGGGIIE